MREEVLQAIASENKRANATSGASWLEILPSSSAGLRRSVIPVNSHIGVAAEPTPSNHYLFQQADATVRHPRADPSVRSVHLAFQRGYRVKCPLLVTHAPVA